MYTMHSWKVYYDIDGGWEKRLLQISRRNAHSRLNGGLRYTGAQRPPTLLSYFM